MTIWTKDRVIDLAVKIDGWMDREELGWLYDRAKEVPEGGIWVEVGCWKGRSFFATAMGLPNGSEFHAVDTWGGDGSSEAHWEAREMPGWILANFRLAVKGVEIARPHDAPFALIHHDSSLDTTKLPFFRDNPIDAVFIDGLHTYEAVKQDINAWYPLVKPGGLVAGHDYHLESVQRSVQEKFPHEACCGAKNIWYMYKGDR